MNSLQSSPRKAGVLEVVGVGKFGEGEWAA